MPQFFMDSEIAPKNLKEFQSVWIVVLMVQMDRAPSRNVGHQKFWRLKDVIHFQKKLSGFSQNPMEICIVF